MSKLFARLNVVARSGGGEEFFHCCDCSHRFLMNLCCFYSYMAEVTEQFRGHHAGQHGEGG